MRSSNSSRNALRREYMESVHGQVYYWSAGTGPAVVCIHQSGNTSEEYAGLVPLLSGRCRLIALDLPGHGRSEIPPSELTVDDYAELVVELMNELAVERAHLIGHHGGALTALCVAANHSSRVEKSILSGMGPPRDQTETQAFIESLTANRSTIYDDPGFVAKTWARYVDRMSEDGDIGGLMKPFQAYLTSHLSPYRSILVNLRWDRRDALGRAPGPTLLLKGTKDPYVSDQAPLLDMMQNTEMLEVPGGGAFMFYDRPDLCADILTKYFELSEPD